MHDLQLVGFTTDRRGLIFRTRAGARAESFVVPITAELVELITGLVNRPDQLRELPGASPPAAPAAPEIPDVPDAETDADSTPARRPVAAAADDGARPRSQLSVRDIQARLRTGEEVSRIAREAGVDDDWIERFAAPVRAEQRRIIDQALAARLRRSRAGLSAVPLRRAVGVAMAEKGLAFTVPAFDAAWSARLVGHDRWAVEFTYRHRGRVRTVTWHFDATTDELTTSDRTASQLGFVDGEVPADLERPVALDGVIGAADATPIGIEAPEASRPRARRSPRAEGGEERAVASPVTDDAPETGGAAATAPEASRSQAAPDDEPVAKRTRKPAARKRPPKQATARKAAAKKQAATKKAATTKKAAKKRAATKKARPGKAGARKAAGKQSTAKKAATRKAAAKKQAPTKKAATKTSARKTAGAAGATARTKGTARKKAAATKRSPAATTKKKPAATERSAAERRSVAKKASPKRRPAKQEATATRAPAKKRATKAAGDWSTTERAAPTKARAEEAAAEEVPAKRANSEPTAPPEAPTRAVTVKAVAAAATPSPPETSEPGARVDQPTTAGPSGPAFPAARGGPAPVRLPETAVRRRRRTVLDDAPDGGGTVNGTARTGADGEPDTARPAPAAGPAHTVRFRSGSAAPIRVAARARTAAEPSPSNDNGNDNGNGNGAARRRPPRRRQLRAR